MDKQVLDLCSAFLAQCLALSINFTITWLVAVYCGKFLFSLFKYFYGEYRKRKRAKRINHGNA